MTETHKNIAINVLNEPQKMANHINRIKIKIRWKAGVYDVTFRLNEMRFFIQDDSLTAVIHIHINTLTLSERMVSLCST